jgi:folate-binding protein YgfZ
MTAHGVARLTGRTVLRLRGEDVAGFLQGLVTVDMRSLAGDRSLWGALLTPQGRYLFDFFLVREDADTILLECEAERADELLERLVLYRLRRKIEISGAGSDWLVAALAADPADLGLPASPGATARIGDAIVFLDPRLVALGARALVPPAAFADLLGTVGGPEVPQAVFLRRRLQLGVPEGAKDLWPQRSLPLECNFEELGGVSFTKGCFVGQEVTARMHFRTSPRRRLLPVRIEGGTVEAGTEVRTGDDREAGTIQRVEGDIGLALLRVEHLFRPEARPFRAGGARIEPRIPDWLQLQEKNPLQEGGTGV